MVPSLALELSQSPTTSKAFGAAGQAMAELFTAGCIGSACVQKGYLNTIMVQSLSKTCFSILLPMFLGTSIMNTVQKYGLNLSSISVPLIAIVHALTLYTISRFILLPVFDIDGDSVEGRATNVCCAFGNAGVVPLIFVEALFRNSDSDILQKAFSIVSMYLLGWSPLFWSFGRNALLGGQSQIEMSMAETETSKGDDVNNMIIPSWRERISYFTSLFPPPVVGVCFGLLASLPFLNSLIMRSIDTPDNKAPFQVVFNCCQNLGRAANPVALLVLTSSLALGNVKRQASQVQEVEQELELEQGEFEIPLLKRWSCVSIARFIVSPLLMVTLLQSLYKVGLIGPMDGSDAMLWFILILEASMPCAQNTVLMLQVAEKPVEASRLARFLFTIYATAMVPVVLVSTILLERCNFTV